MHLSLSWGNLTGPWVCGLPGRTLWGSLRPGSFSFSSSDSPHPKTPWPVPPHPVGVTPAGVTLGAAGGGSGFWSCSGKSTYSGPGASWSQGVVPCLTMAWVCSPGFWCVGRGRPHASPLLLAFGFPPWKFTREQWKQEQGDRFQGGHCLTLFTA